MCRHSNFHSPPTISRTTSLLRVGSSNFATLFVYVRYIKETSNFKSLHPPRGGRFSHLSLRFWVFVETHFHYPFTATSLSGSSSFENCILNLKNVCALQEKLSQPAAWTWRVMSWLTKEEETEIFCFDCSALQSSGDNNNHTFVDLPLYCIQ